MAKSGYNYQLKYKDYSNNTNTSIKLIRQRRVIWYNSPYSRNVKTKISSIFLRLIKDIFHTKHPLHKMFNKNTLKLSYSPNLEQTIITAHNKSVTKCNTAPISQAGCNCRNVETCPLQGECTIPNIVYQANEFVPLNVTVEKYVGIFSTAFKARYYSHLGSFRYPTKCLKMI